MLPEEKERNRKVAQKVIAGLRSRNMEGYFVETKEEALGLALDLIPQGRVSAGAELILLRKSV